MGPEVSYCEVEFAETRIGNIRSPSFFGSPQTVPVTRVTCRETGEYVESYSHTEASVKRGLAALRDQCKDYCRWHELAPGEEDKQPPPKREPGK
jgi:hypothetical protein